MDPSTASHLDSKVTSICFSSIPGIYYAVKVFVASLQNDICMPAKYWFLSQSLQKGIEFQCIPFEVLSICWVFSSFGWPKTGGFECSKLEQLQLSQATAKGQGLGRVPEGGWRRCREL